MTAPGGIRPRSIPREFVAPFTVGDVVTVSSPVEGDTQTYEAIVSAVSPISSIEEPAETDVVWLVDVYSPTWIPARLRQAAYGTDGPDPARATLTFVRSGQWPPGASADAGNRLTIGTDGGLFLGPET